MAIVWSQDPFVVRAGGGSTSAAEATGEHTSPSRVRRRPLGSPTVRSPGAWRREWAHHAAPGGTGLLTGTRSGAAAPASSMRCPGQAWAPRGPTPPAVDTAFGPTASARADRPDTGRLAHSMAPQAPRGPWALLGSGDVWRAPAAHGTVPVSSVVPGWPGSQSGAACGTHAGRRAASAVVKTPRRPASGYAGGGPAGSPCSGRGPGR